MNAKTVLLIKLIIPEYFISTSTKVGSKSRYKSMRDEARINIKKLARRLTLRLSIA